MPNVKFRASRRTVTSYSGFSIIGQCLVPLRDDNEIRHQVHDASGGAHHRSMANCCSDQNLSWKTVEQLGKAPEAVIKRYQAYAIHEQFQIEFKTDLDLERLPSGKFAINYLILHLAH